MHMRSEMEQQIRDSDIERDREREGVRERKKEKTETEKHRVGKQKYDRKPDASRQQTVENPRQLCCLLLPTELLPLLWFG